MFQCMNVDGLETTTFSGRHFTKIELRRVIETVKTFQNLSLKELALTICEHLSWRSHNGSLKVLSCITLLEKLEKLGLVILPAKRVAKKPKSRVVSITEASCPKADVSGLLREVGEIELKLVSSNEDFGLFKEYLERYHYLGYRQPVGQNLRYFIVAKSPGREEKLGCLLFAPCCYAMKARDEWIGWNLQHKLQRLHQVIGNKRFLIFPWVKVPNLASHALSLIPKRLANDWEREFGSRPVLIETFVDPSKYEGTCYQAANWQRIGQTSPVSPYKDSRGPGSIKDIYTLPLVSDFREVLKGAKVKPKPKRLAATLARASVTDDTFDKMGSLWAKIMEVVKEITCQFDEAWQKRHRVIDSMMLVMLIFRLVSSKDRKGYGSTIDELWGNCRKLNIPLPQSEGICASSFSKARPKLCESIFIRINERLLGVYEPEASDSELWHGRRIFAVDGSKLNLPRELLKVGYRLPTPTSYRPQGLVSCLYRLKSAMPYDFLLHKHMDERRCAVEHLSKLKPDDVVTYDRGYFSYVMLYCHQQSGIHAIFRLKKNTYEPIRNFWKSGDIDTVVTIMPEGQHLKKLKEKYPNIKFRPISLRLIKYHIAGETYCLGTTLFDNSIFPQDFQDAYHGRWGIEELYKISKQIFDVEQFHAKSERGVKQEVYAHFTLITINRVLGNHADKTRLDLLGEQSTEMPTAAPNRTNFKNTIGAFFRNLESLFLGSAVCCFDGVVNWMKSSIRHFQRVRPGRSYPRKSMRPANKWHAANKKLGAPAASLS